MNKVLLITTLALLATFSRGQEWKEFYSNFHTKEFKDLDGWKYTNSASDNVFYTCKDQMILGGPLSFGTKATLSKTFKLPAHYQVKVQARIWKIDTWDYERLIIMTDGYQWETLWGHDDAGQDLCGQSGHKLNQDNFYDIEFKLQHTQSALSLVFTSTLDQEASDESWAVSHIKILYLACPSECATCTGPDATQCSFWLPDFRSWFNLNDGIDGDWKVENGKLEKTVCAGIPIVGGPNKIGAESVVQKIVQGLPPHFRILIQFQFWKIDSWDNEQAQLYVDRELSWYQNFQFSEGVELCYGGVDDKGGSPEKVVNINHNIPHVFSAVNLKFTSTLDEGMDNESWGIRQFQLYVAKCADKCIECNGPLPKDCTVCETPYIFKGGECTIQGEWFEIAKDFNSNDFTTISQDWVVRNAMKDNADVITECGGVKLVGGFEKFGKGAIVSRKFKQLPPHKRLRITLEVWKIDNWDNEELWIKLGDTVVWKRTFGWADPNSMDVCGSTKPDSGFESKVRVDVVIGHEKPSVEFIISSNLDEDAYEESWAFRDFRLFYEAADDCATLYTECDYKGESFDLCDQAENFQAAKIPSNIKSIQVPKDATVVLYDEVLFNGQKVEITQSQPCIDSFSFSLAQLYQKVENDEQSDEPFLAVNTKL